MKILIASFSFPPNHDGVSAAAAAMASGFLDKGWQVDVATLPAKSPRDRLEWRGASLHEFNVTGNGQPNHPFQGDVEAYRAFLKNGDWDVVIFHTHLWMLLIALDFMDRIRGRKILVSHSYTVLQWVRSKSFPWGFGVLAWSLWQAFRMAFWLRKLDRCVYLSGRMDFQGFFDHWIARAVGYQGRRVIPNGVDLEVRGSDPAAFRLRIGIPEASIMFLCVANYSRGKDQGYAARAFRAANLPDAVLVFIGSEFNADSSRFQAEDADLPEERRSGHIVWLEKQSREDTLNAFASCDAFVLSSGGEAQPIALLEAMRESKPWIAREAGCIADMPGGVCVRSEPEMTRQMIRIAGDAGIRSKLGGEGRRAVETTFNVHHYVDSYCALVTELVAPRVPRH